MLASILEEREIQPICNFDSNTWQSVREKYIEVLCREEYGMPLPPPSKLEFEVTGKNDSFAAGTAVCSTVLAHTEIFGESFTFPFTALIPKGSGRYPFFVHIDFEATVPNRYYPAEEIVNNGFAVLHFNFNDVTIDKNDMTDKLAGIVSKNNKDSDTAPGKIMMWAWAAMRVMDYATTLECLDLDNAAILGHSRLGKTALVTGMLDTRFKYVISNDSGCSGAAITKDKTGEHIQYITEKFPYWFCNNYKKYIDENNLFFDQHLLLATVAPRVLVVGSAAADAWADPNSEYLCCVAASKAWENLGVKGLIHEDCFPNVESVLDEGNVCYQIRADGHYLSRRDWNTYFNIIKKKMNQ